METLVGLMLASSPIVLTVALLAAAERRDRRVRAEVGRQIALTDALHARLGALLAPVVRRQGRGWQVSVAVPIERPSVVGAVLATADEVFGREAYELRLRRQAPTPLVARPRRTARTVQELSWT